MLPKLWYRQLLWHKILGPIGFNVNKKVEPLGGRERSGSPPAKS